MSKSDDSKGEPNTASPDALPFSITLHVRDTCMCLHLQRAARAVARRFDEALRQFELTNGQFSLLMSLNRPNPPVMRDVAALLAMDRTSLTAMLKPLERRGLVTVIEDPDDRRSRRLVLQAAGRTLLARALPAWTATEAAVEAQLQPDEPERLRNDLRRVA